MANTARELSFKALVKRADPKPEPDPVVYNFRHPKKEKVKKPGRPYGE